MHARARTHLRRDWRLGLLLLVLFCLAAGQRVLIVRSLAADRGAVTSVTQTQAVLTEIEELSAEIGTEEPSR